MVNGKSIQLRTLKFWVYSPYRLTPKGNLAQLKKKNELSLIIATNTVYNAIQLLELVLKIRDQFGQTTSWGNADLKHFAAYKANSMRERSNVA